MTDFGLQPTGFVVKRLADILSEYAEAYRSSFSSNVDLANDGPFGQILGITADREAALWELLDQVYQSGFVSGAKGTSQDQLLRLVNVLRLPAKSTQVDVRCVGTPGTVIPAGQVLKTADTQVPFSNALAGTIGGDGTVVISFEAQSTGPISCFATTLTVITTPVAGWASASNVADGVVGRDVESDAAVNTRRLSAAIAIISSSAPAVMARVWALPNVVEVKEIQNLSGLPDGDSRPPNSFELVVRGGASSDIRTMIFATKPAGIASVGNVSGTVADLRGELQPIKFSRPAVIPVYITVDITVDGKFPADGLVQIRNAILAYGQNILAIGQAVTPFKIEQTIETPGIVTFTMSLGVNPNPADGSPLPIGPVQIAAFDSSRLVVRKA